jgi:threonine dehydratase
MQERDKKVPPTIEDIRDAAKRIAPYAHRTPILTSTNINEMLGATVFFKCENFQKVGAFKFRGACNSVFSLDDAALKKGVATHSSGNHAAALALAARMKNIPAYIVMPSNAPIVKKEAVASYGGKITFCEPTLAARETTLQKIVDETGATFIPPFDYTDVIAGQGTAALELLDEVGELDAVIAPVGGGGLLSGTAIVTKSLRPKAFVFAGEPDGADDAARSFAAKELLHNVQTKTIADGLLTSLSPLTFSIIQKNVDAIFTVSDAAIIRAMRLVWERMKIIIEPSCATPLAALLEKKHQPTYDLHGKRIGIILSGGNVDLERLPWMMRNEE